MPIGPGTYDDLVTLVRWAIAVAVWLILIAGVVWLLGGAVAP